MDIRYRIQGGIPLRGDVEISGSKNAALPLIAGSLLCSGETVLHNVPWIRDVKKLLKILEFLGAETSFQDGTVRIRTHNVRSKPIPAEHVSSLRASIILLGPMLTRFGVVEMAYPGGDVIGKRPVQAHIAALEQLGAEDMSTEDLLHLQGDLKPGTVILPEFSVTATENAILAAAILPGATRIELAAAEPHVQDLCRLVQGMGAEVWGIGTHTLIIKGKKDLQCTSHTVIPDYLEVGAFTIAALVTKGKIRMHNVSYRDILSFLDAVRRFGGAWKYDDEERILFVDGEISSLRAMEIKTMIFPGFPTDLHPAMGVAMTQAQGVSRILERMYERRFGYLYELEKMGAHIELLNDRQALIIGPTPLRGRTVASHDIRAGAAVVLAALCAEGETIITDVRYIERGYVGFDEKLRGMGAKIEKLEMDEARVTLEGSKK